MGLPRDQHDAMSLLGQLLLTQGHPERAAHIYASLEILEPGEPVNVRALALAHARAGQPEKALDALDRLALAGAVDQPFHLLRAQVLSELGRADEAAAAMRAYMALRSAVAPAAKPLPKRAAKP